MKRIFKLLVLTLAFCFTLLLVGCKVKVQEISMDEEIVKAAVSDNVVSLDELKLNVVYEDGKVEVLDVVDEMLVAGDLEELKQPGVYTLTFAYGGKMIDVVFEIESEVSTVYADTKSIQEALAQETFDYKNIKLNVTYIDGNKKTINLDESMLSKYEAKKFTYIGSQTINFEYKGVKSSFYITLPTPKGGLNSFELEASEIEEAYKEEEFKHEYLALKLNYKSGEVGYVPLASSMLSSLDLAKLYIEGTQTVQVKYAGLTKEFTVNVPQNKYFELNSIKDRKEGEMVVVRAYSTDYSSKAIYLYSGDFLSYATSISAVDGEKVGLKLGQEVILAGTKTTDKDGVVYLKNITFIAATENKDELVSKVITSNDLSDSLYKVVSLKDAVVKSLPEKLNCYADCSFEVESNGIVYKIGIPKDTDDKLTQKLFITISELVVGHELVLENLFVNKLSDGTFVLSFIRDTEFSYVKINHEYQKPEEGEKDPEFEALLEEYFLYFLGDSPFNLNYQIFDIEAFDKEHGTNLADAVVVPTDPDSMTPEYEIEYYNEIKAKKARLEEFDYNKLSASQKLTYDVLMDQFNSTLKYFEFNENGENIYFYYGTQFGSYLGYQAQLPSIIAEYRFDDKKDIENYLEYLKTTQLDFEALFTFEKAKMEKGEGNQMTDYVIDLVIGQCDAFIDTTEENYLITVFNERIGNYDFLTSEEVEKYKELNTQYVNEYFVEAYKWLKERMLELKEMNDDTKKGSLSETETGKKYYEVLFQDKCGSDLTIPELIEYIDAKLAEYDELAQIYTAYDGNLMIDANLIKYKETGELDYYGSLYSIIPFLQEKFKEDFPELPEEFILGENIAIKEISDALKDNSSPAFYLVSPMDANIDEVIYINPKDFAEVGTYMFTTIAHEAWPGHLYQNVYFKNNKSHDIRMVMSYTGYSEGWANYIENYVAKYVLDDYAAQQMFLLNAISSLSSCRIDIGVNYEGWGIEQIIEQYGLTMDDVNSGRYTWSNGDTVSIDDFEEIYYFYVEVPTNYLMYFFSCAQLMDIKAEFKEKMGVYYSEKLFHTIYLETGDASWPIIKKVYDDYAAKWGTNGTAYAN